MRLRAVVSLGELHHPGAVPALLSRLSDANRLVRLRAGEALVDLKEERAAIFEQVVACHDRYGLHAYLAALDNAGLQAALEAELKATPRVTQPARQALLEVLRTGKLPAQQLVPQGMTHSAVASRS